MKKLLTLLIVGLVLGISSAAYAREDMQDWAKELLRNWTEGYENGCEAATGGLASLDSDELKELRAMIVADMESGEGKIVRPMYGPAGREALKMLNTIDDLLGQLSYDRIVVGELMHTDEPAMHVVFYDIKTEDGEIIEDVKVGQWTLKPDCGFREKTGVMYKLYLEKNTIQKIGLIEAVR